MFFLSSGESIKAYNSSIVSEERAGSPCTLRIVLFGFLRLEELAGGRYLHLDRLWERQVIYVYDFMDLTGQLTAERLWYR